MRSINFELILRGTPELAWVGDDAIQKLVTIASLELYQAREIVFQGKNESPHLLIVVSGALHSMFVSGLQDKLDHIYYENQVFGLGDIFGIREEKERMLVSESTLLLLY